jgi:hypothetical protein
MRISCDEPSNWSVTSRPRAVEFHRQSCRQLSAKSCDAATAFEDTRVHLRPGCAQDRKASEGAAWTSQCSKLRATQKRRPAMVRLFLRIPTAARTRLRRPRRGTPNATVERNTRSRPKRGDALHCGLHHPVVKRYLGKGAHALRETRLDGAQFCLARLTSRVPPTIHLLRR